MYNVYFTSLESKFARELASWFERNGFHVTTGLTTGIEFFVDTTETLVEGDDRAVGEGVSYEAGVLAYEKYVSEPLDKLTKVLQNMVGRKRVCFLSSRNSSVSESTAVSGFGKNMSRAAMHNILTITKNGLIEQGFTFRLFDPMTGEYPAEKAAAAAFVYFSRDRFRDDSSSSKFREDERNLMIRDAYGREIPW